jgi:hypothetical protein
MPAIGSIEKQVMAKLHELPLEKQREVLDFATSLAEREAEARQPLADLYGILQGTGDSISAEEIDAARKEMWAAFPRGHFFGPEDEEPGLRPSAGTK